jgi:hypothetical protein
MVLIQEIYVKARAVLRHVLKYCNILRGLQLNCISFLLYHWQIQMGRTGHMKLRNAVMCELGNDMIS